MEFRKKYGESVTNALKRLQISEKFIQFLTKTQGFKLRKSGTDYYISLLDSAKRAIANPQPLEGNSQARDRNQQSVSIVDLEASLVKIVKSKMDRNTQAVGLEIVSSEFYAQYKKGINQVLQELKLQHPFVKFLKGSSQFQLVRSGNSYLVTLNSDRN